MAEEAKVRIFLPLLALAALIAISGCESAPPSARDAPLPAPGHAPGGNRPLAPYAALESSDAEERVVGVELAARTMEEAAVPQIRRMLEDPDAGVRAQSVDALRRRSSAVDTERVRALAVDQDPRVRREVVRFLAAHDGKNSLGLMRELALGDEDDEVAALAIVSLANLDATASELKHVAERLGRDEERTPRLTSALVIYMARHADKLSDVERASLAKFLQNDEPGLRQAVAQALGDCGEPTAATPLAAAFKLETEPVAASAMLLAEGKCGGRALGQDAREILESRTHWLLQASAASYLGLEPAPRGGGERGELLQLVLVDPSRDPRVRQTAAASLAKLNETVRLEAALEDRDPDTRKAALMAYPREPRERVLALAMARITDVDREVRWAALRVRASLGDESAYPEVVEGIRGGFTHATDALALLLEITGGQPNHGFDYDAWKRWLVDAKN